MFKYRNFLIGLILLLSAVILVHNISAYPVTAGMDYWRRETYARILSEQWRLPDYEETSEVYDAPLFYFVSGLLARAVDGVSRFSWTEALAAFRFAAAALALVSFWLWTKTFSRLNPKNKSGPVLFLFLLVTLPVFYRVGAMYLSELVTLFWASLTLYWFISRKKPLVLALLISLGMLTRVSFLAVALAVSLGLVLERNFKTLITVILISALASGWFYWGRFRGSVLNIGYDATVLAQTEKRGLDFYFYFPLKTMLSYPFRPVLSQPSYLGPIYYADFWGDYWNYFPQTRFGFGEFSAARANRENFSPARKQYLAWQSRVNLIPTLLMAGAWLWLILKRRSRAELTLLTVPLFVWGSLVILAGKYTGHGEVIKASYTAFIAPIYVYALTVALLSLKKIKFVFWLLLLILIFAGLNNLVFAWL